MTTGDADAPAGPATEGRPAELAGEAAPPTTSRKWRWRLVFALLVINLFASAVAIGWVAWVVADPDYWFGTVQGPQGEQGPAGAPGQQGDAGMPGPPGEPGVSADDETLNRLTDRLAEVETELASNDLGLEAQRLSTRVERLQSQLVGLCDQLRDSFLALEEVCPEGEPAAATGGG